ncbi:hypothetical protein Q2T40_06530 [Winogradskyella maritima]|uniref:DKNYY family protein n=1 Tax=Winogradskyella maritima TaxID=1517766 RepID=A0ABV8AP10_9FLAO|nr:hypothetical protein [Winogradskyella maritima]
MQYPTKHFSVLSICLIIFIGFIHMSCSSSDDVSPEENPEINFYALAVGNSWVYTNLRYNINTQEYVETNVVDSVSIVNKELVDGEVFFRFRTKTTGNANDHPFANSNGEEFELLRDSTGYLIRPDGSVKFTNNNFTPRVIFEESFGLIYDELISNQETVMVGAGEFESSYMQRYAIFNDGQRSNATDHFYYSYGVGLIYETISFISIENPIGIKTLASYRLAD